MFAYIYPAHEAGINHPPAYSSSSNDPLVFTPAHLPHQDRDANRNTTPRYPPQAQLGAPESQERQQAFINRMKGVKLDEQQNGTLEQRREQTAQQIGTEETGGFRAILMIGMIAIFLIVIIIHI